MSSSISRFRLITRTSLLAWAIAGALFFCIESLVFWLSRPNEIERSNLITYPIQTTLNMRAERWIIWEKLRSLQVQEPVAVHVGDSAGFYGLMPEVVSQYIGGKQILNLSCCANQGFHGYLAELEFALRRNPSLRMAIIYMSPVVVPSFAQWREGTPPTMGDDLESDLVSPWRFLLPPSNALRPAIFRHVLINRFRGHFNWAPPRLDTPAFNRANVMLERNGYMIEHDVETYTPDCVRELAVDKATGRTYFDLMMEEFRRLGEKYEVTPVLLFQPVACKSSAGTRPLEAEVERMRMKYPTISIPFDFIETWPANFFSVPAHVQRTIVIETSRRMGRVMRDLLSGSKRYEFGNDITRPDYMRHMTIVSATQSEVCGYDPEFRRGPFADITPVFKEACSGKTTCRYEPGSDPRESAPPRGCKVVYSVSYQCAGGPVRTIRYAGKAHVPTLEIDCRATAGLDEDPMPYGIQVAEATYGGNIGADRGNATFPVQALCDGRFDCNFPIFADRLAIDVPGPKDFTVHYRCGRELEERKVRLDSAPGSGEPIRLNCLS